MANKKAEILTMDSQVVSPITLATNVLLDDGRTAQDLLDSRDESMFSPTITTSSSISKVGQGDNVDFSENVIDGTYKSCVLKGKTLVNYNAEGNDRNEYVCMPSVEGESVTVNGTVEGKVKSAILKGNTLVNLVPNKGENTIVGTGDRLIKYELPYILSKNKKYLLCCNIKTITTPSNTGQILFSLYSDDGNTTQLLSSSTSTGYLKTIFTTLDQDYSTQKLWVYIRNNETTSATFDNIMLLEYQDGMENWDIPYFEGVQSVKMPVLTTTGKNLFDVNKGREFVYNRVPFTKFDGSVYTIRVDSVDSVEIENDSIILNNITYANTVQLQTKHYVDEGVTYNISIINESRTSIRVRGITYYNQHGEILGGYWDGIGEITPPKGCNYLIVGYTCELGNGRYKIQFEQGTTSTTYEPYKTNILSTPEDLVLRGIGEARDELNLLTGEKISKLEQLTVTNNTNWLTQTSSHSDCYSFYYNPQIGKSDGLLICDNLPSINRLSIGEGCRITGTGRININILKSKLNDSSLNSLNDYLAINPLTFIYELPNASIKTVDLSDSVVYSYNDTTHYTCSSEEGSLLPTLTIEEGVKYKVIIKPSTKYSIVFNRTEVASSLTVDLGGVTANVVSTTKGKNIVQITTSSTLSHSYVIFKGLGNVIKDVQVIEGEVVGDEPYFEGMCDCKSPILLNCGKNLFNCTNVEDINNSYTVVNMNNQNYITTDTLVEKGKQYTLSLHANISGATGNVLYLGYMNYSNIVGGVEKAGHNILTIDSAVDKTTSITFTAQTTDYIKIYIATGKVGYNVVLSNVQIEEGSVATSYEPHKSNILSCETYFDEVTQSDKMIVLRSLPNGVCDTLDLETGEYVQRIGEIVFDGSENWLTALSGEGFYRHYYKESTIGVGNVIADHTFTNLKNIQAINNNTILNKVGTHGEVNGYIYVGTHLNVSEFKNFLSTNPLIIQYPLSEKTDKTVDLKQHPFAYKDGYVVLTSSSEGVSLTPTIEYSLITNRLGQIQTNQKLVEKQQAQIDELESMVITNLVNTQYQQALNEIKLGVK